MVIVDSLIFLSAPWHGSIEADIPVRLCVDAVAIRGFGTFLFTRAGIRFAAGKRAAPFAGMLLFTVPPVDHAEAGHAQGSAIRVNGEGSRDGLWPSPVRVEVNKRADIPFFTEAIGGIVVMGGIQAEVLDGDIGVNGLKFPQGDNGADAVVSPGVQEMDVEGKVNGEVCIVRTEHVKGVSEVRVVQVAVPAPVCIGVGEMARAGAVRDAVLLAMADLMPVGGSMGMDTGAVTGEGNAIGRDKAVL